MTHTALWIRCLLAALSGATVTLSLAPWTWWPLGAMSAATLLWLWHSALPQHILRIAWCYGFGFFGAGISWVYVSIHEFGNASAPFRAILRPARPALCDYGLGISLHAFGEAA